MKNKRLGGLALIPILVFLVLYLGSGIYFDSVQRESVMTTSPS